MFSLPHLTRVLCVYLLKLCVDLFSSLFAQATGTSFILLLMTCLLLELTVSWWHDELRAVLVGGAIPRFEVTFFLGLICAAQRSLGIYDLIMFRNMFDVGSSCVYIDCLACI